MKLTTLHELFVDELKDLYSAEHQLVKALPKMAKGATSPKLKAAFEDHLAVTREQVERLERVFKQLGVSPRGKKCKAMEGLIEEGKEILEEDGDPAVIDAALIGAAQRVEHYEMAGYGCVRTYARQLGYKQVANWLQKTLDEEADADKKLTSLAESSVNAEAEEADGNGEAEETSLAGRVTEAASTAASTAAETVGHFVKSATATVRNAVAGKSRHR